MKSKKIVLALSLVIALGATLMAGGSLAWFTDTDEAVNTFTMGGVEIRQIETNQNGTPFSSDQPLIPAISNTTDTPTDDPNFIHKIVTVKNVGTSKAYVQTYIAVPKALDNGLLKWDVNLDDDHWKAVDGDLTVDGIQPVGTADYDLDGNGSKEANALNVYLYRYTAALDKDAATTTLLNGVYIDETADMKAHHDDTAYPDKVTSAYFVWKGSELTDYDLNAIKKLTVLVATQGVQADGFTDADNALGTAFPNHPWKNN